ncbi:hypothetical protein [uncultured Variovorax sp.]|uniref:hypothetical protein n=1 Tax=uncultured Variovorax sp. TaxID=114708 RepID=UPI0025E90061|nr:hypothetical protein [uncultured Variovorax sp.]
MDLFSTGIDATTDLLAFPEWKLEVQPAKASDYGSRYCAVITRAGKEFCYLSIDPVVGGDQEAYQRLAERARQWIIEFQELNLGQCEPGPPPGSTDI